MNLCRVDGNVVSTICHPSMRGWPMLLCQPLDDQGNDRGQPVLALDPLGAGLHDRVILTTDGSSTQETVGDPNSPLRNMIIAILDD